MLQEKPDCLQICFKPVSNDLQMLELSIKHASNMLQIHVNMLPCVNNCTYASNIFQTTATRIITTTTIIKQEQQQQQEQQQPHAAEE